MASSARRAVDADDERRNRERLGLAFARLAELRAKREAGGLDPAETRECAALRAHLVTSHLRLARHVALRFANRGEPLDDLVQVSSIGLLKAVERFAPERGVPFASYAIPTIVGELRRHFRDKGWTIRVPRRLQELNLALNRATEELALVLGRMPSLAELARHLKTSAEAVLEAREAGPLYHPLSLDTSLRGAPGGHAPRTLVDCVGGPDRDLGMLQDRLSLEQGFGKLAGRERVVLYLRFHEGMGQSAVARRLNVSQMQISRIQKTALGKLREALAD